MTYSEVEPKENRIFRCLFRHRRPLVTEINMAGYGDGRSTSSRDALFAIAIYRRVLLFVWSFNQIPPCLFRSRKDGNDFRDIEKHDFRTVLRHPMSSADNLANSQLAAS